MARDVRLPEEFLMSTRFTILKRAWVSGGKMEAKCAPELGVGSAAIQVKAVGIKIL